MIISENIPSISRGRLVLGAFGFQALGALAGTAVGWLVLLIVPDLSAWRWMYATVIIPALAVTIGRFYITESANWLLDRGAMERAHHAARRLLIRKPQYPTNIELAQRAAPAVEGKHQNHGFANLFTPAKQTRDDLCLGPMVSAGSRNVRYRHLYTDSLAATIGGPVEHVRSVSDLISDGIVAAKARP